MLWNCSWQFFSVLWMEKLLRKDWWAGSKLRGKKKLVYFNDCFRNWRRCIYFQKITFRSPVFLHSLGLIAFTIGSAVPLKEMPWALQFAEWLFYEYSAEKVIDHLKPVQSSELINFFKSSEDVYNLFFFWGNELYNI